MSREIIDAKKKWLGRYKGVCSQISRLSERVATLEAKINGVRSPRLTGMPRGGTPVTTADLIGDKIELEERLERLQKRRSSVRREILDAIDTLDNEKLSEILEYWFIQCMNADDIADELGYTTRHVWRLYSQAIEEIEISALETDDDQTLSSE